MTMKVVEHVQAILVVVLLVALLVAGVALTSSLVADHLPIAGASGDTSPPAYTYAWVRPVDESYEYRDKGNAIARVWIITIDGRKCYLAAGALVASAHERSIWCQP